MKSFALGIFVVGLVGIGSLGPALADSSQPDTIDAWKNDKAAHDARCNGVTASQAALYQQCATEKTTLDQRLTNLQAKAAGGTTMGGSHTVGGDQ
jgi:hypothetical protein